MGRSTRRSPDSHALPVTSSRVLGQRPGFMEAVRGSDASRSSDPRGEPSIPDRTGHCRLFQPQPFLQVSLVTLIQVLQQLGVVA